MKRFFPIFLVIVLLIVNNITVNACNETQSDDYVLDILFGDGAINYSSNDDVKILLDAVYLCCEQADNQGQEKLSYLKDKKVKGASTLSSININNTELIDCAHISWDTDYLLNKKVRTNRKKLLQNSVNKVFDFGTVNNLFGSEKGQCNSFAALLYYSHILADYIADDPDLTNTIIKGKQISSYCGQAYVEVNGNRPSFTTEQKKNKESYTIFSSLDSYGRCGIAFAVLGPDTIAPPNSRDDIGNIKPSGWNQEKYQGIVNSDPPYIYNRCHLIAHQLANNDEENNLITGTRYLNEEGMKPLEDKVAKYINETGNHVLYRATPIFKGDNKVASGVQLEAYSIEDAGKLSFNYYCYNVQPGVEINYATGKNEMADVIYNAQGALPFAVSNPSDSNPDLIYEMNKHLSIIFTNHSDVNYVIMMGDLNSIAYEARSLGNLNEKPAQTYMKMKECEYKYYQTLKLYVPLLLNKENFFRSAFG